MKRILLLLALAGLVIGGTYFLRSSGQPPAAPARANVVLITIDTLRADRLRRGFTPAIDALAERGTRFDNARTTVPLTLPAHVTIMTGQLPVVHGVRENGFVFTARPNVVPLA